MSIQSNGVEQKTVRKQLDLSGTTYRVEAVAFRRHADAHMRHMLDPSAWQFGKYGNLVSITPEPTDEIRGEIADRILAELNQAEPD